MNQFELNQRSRDLLERVRHQSEVLSLYDMPAKLAEPTGNGPCRANAIPY